MRRLNFTVMKSATPGLIHDHVGRPALIFSSYAYCGLLFEAYRITWKQALIPTLHNSHPNLSTAIIDILIVSRPLEDKRKKMYFLTLLSSTIISLLSNTLFCALQVVPANAQLHPRESAQYQALPALREQADILNAWREERLTGIPTLLQKYNIDAWLVGPRNHFCFYRPFNRLNTLGQMSQREYAEDTVFWSIKDARQFSARRRTVVLFHTNTSTLASRPNPIIWIDNTGDVWPELRSILEDFDPARIALNTDRSIAFGGGLHVGEYDVLNEELGEKWMQRTVNEPMLGVEFVAKRVPGQIEYYRKMQESIWAMIEEGFSEKVVEPSVTTTTVSERNLGMDTILLTYSCRAP